MASTRFASGIDDFTKPLAFGEKNAEPGGEQKLLHPTDEFGPRQGHWDIASNIGSFVDDRCPTVWQAPTSPPVGAFARQHDHGREISGTVGITSGDRENAAFSEKLTTIPRRASGVKPIDGSLLKKLFKATCNDQSRAAVESDRRHQDTQSLGASAHKQRACGSKATEPTRFQVPATSSHGIKIKSKDGRTGIIRLPRPHDEHRNAPVAIELAEAVQKPLAQGQTRKAAKSPLIFGNAKAIQIKGKNGEEAFVNMPGWPLSAAQSPGEAKVTALGTVANTEVSCERGNSEEKKEEATKKQKNRKQKEGKQHEHQDRAELAQAAAEILMSGALQVKPQVSSSPSRLRDSSKRSARVSNADLASFFENSAVSRSRKSRKEMQPTVESSHSTISAAREHKTSDTPSRVPSERAQTEKVPSFISFEEVGQTLYPGQESVWKQSSSKANSRILSTKGVEEAGRFGRTTGTSNFAEKPASAEVSAQPQSRSASARTAVLADEACRAMSHHDDQDCSTSSRKSREKSIRNGSWQGEWAEQNDVQNPKVEWVAKPPSMPIASIGQSPSNGQRINFPASAVSNRSENKSHHLDVSDWSHAVSEKLRSERSIENGRTSAPLTNLYEATSQGWLQHASGHPSTHSVHPQEVRGYAAENLEQAWHYVAEKVDNGHFSIDADPRLGITSSKPHSNAPSLPDWENEQPGSASRHKTPNNRLNPSYGTASRQHSVHNHRQAGSNSQLHASKQLSINSFGNTKFGGHPQTEVKDWQEVIADKCINSHTNGAGKNDAGSQLIIEVPYARPSTVFAGKGWISPHPLSRSPSEVASPPQSKIILPSEAFPYGATMTYQEWKDIQERGLRQRRNFSHTESSQTRNGKLADTRYRFAGWGPQTTDPHRWDQNMPGAAQSSSLCRSRTVSSGRTGGHNATMVSWPYSDYREIRRPPSSQSRVASGFTQERTNQSTYSRHDRLNSEHSRARTLSNWSQRHSGSQKACDGSQRISCISTEGVLEVMEEGHNVWSDIPQCDEQISDKERLQNYIEGDDASHTRTSQLYLGRYRESEQRNLSGAW